MSKFVYTNAKEDLAKALINWPTTDIRVWPVKAGYAAAVGDLHLDTISAGNRVGASAVAITSPTAVGGLCTCATVTFPSLTIGSTIVAFVFYKHTGTEATSDLIAYIGEDSGGTPFSIPTNGSNVTFTPGAGGVFAL